jgi:hypothetical protein
MRRTFLLATGELVAILLMAAEAHAQIRQPDAFRTTAFEYDSYFTQDVPSQSPSDLSTTPGGMSNGAAQPYSAAPAGGGYAGGCTTGCATVGCTGCAACCDTGCGRWDWLPDGNPCFGGLLPCCNEGEPWKLFNPCCEQWSFGGWLNGGVLTNADGFWNNGAVPFLSTNDPLANQLWAYGERKADTGGYGWDWGARIDYVFGADGPDTQAFGDQGWDFGWNSGGRNIIHHTYGSAIPQLYAEVAYNDLSVKLGRFFTIIGYEVVPAPDNFFYTHSYTMNYGEPFTHTGGLAEYTYSDELTLYGGYVAGWDTGWENLIDAHMAIGGVKLSRWEDASLTYAATAGDFGFGRGDIYMHSLVLDYALTDSWTYVIQSDLAINDNIPGGARDAHWYGVNQYLFYTINDCWSAGGRFEWFRDEDGVRIGGGFPSRGSYYNATLGLNYKPNANVVIRPEVRADWFDASNDATATRPFSGGTKNEQLMAGLDFIFLY